MHRGCGLAEGSPAEHRRCGSTRGAPEEHALPACLVGRAPLGLQGSRQCGHGLVAPAEVHRQSGGQSLLHMLVCGRICVDQSIIQARAVPKAQQGQLQSAARASRQCLLPLLQTCINIVMYLGLQASAS